MASAQLPNPSTLPTTGMEQKPPHDIAELLAYEFRFSDYMWELAIAGGVLLAVVIAFLIWKYRKKPEKVVYSPPPPDPWVVLEQGLREMLPPQPFDNREVQEEYFFQLSMKLREAIELRTEVPATDKTLRELKRPLLDRSPLPRQTTESMLGFLSRADMIKFAEAETNLEEAKTSYESVYDWMNSLRPNDTAKVPATNHQGSLQKMVIESEAQRES